MVTALRVGLGLLLLMVAGCVSTHMQQFIGEDIREVVISDGQPVNAFDYGSGRRVFQFYWGGGSYVVPGVTRTSGSAYSLGSSVYGSATTLSTPPQIVSSQGCLTSYITRWNDEREGWIVEEIRYPQRLAC